jgi:hypothetical protein
VACLDGKFDISSMENGCGVEHTRRTPTTFLSHRDTATSSVAI